MQRLEPVTIVNKFCNFSNQLDFMLYHQSFCINASEDPERSDIKGSKYVLDVQFTSCVQWVFYCVISKLDIRNERKQNSTKVKASD